MSTKVIVRCAVMTAFLIVIQYALSFISGIELVTAVFAVFCYTSGIKQGVFTAISFSLLRCFIYGFMPNVLLLYLIYYTLFAVAFGRLGKSPELSMLFIIASAALAVIFALLGYRGIPVSSVYSDRIKIMFFLLSGVFAFLLFIYIISAFKTMYAKAADIKESASAAALGAFMTICFTLLDDVITPLMFGYSSEAARAYFFAGFMAMLPQTVCAAISIFILLSPLKRVFDIINNL